MTALQPKPSFDSTRENARNLALSEHLSLLNVAVQAVMRGRVCRSRVNALRLFFYLFRGDCDGLRVYVVHGDL